MKKKVFVAVFFLFSVAVFIAGLRLYSYPGLVDKVVTCATVFVNQCTRPGQCSYNLSHGTADCVITCVTKIKMNGVDDKITTTAKCGTWKDASTPPDTGDPTNGDGTPWESPFWQ